MSFVGVDLFDVAVEQATAFAQTIPGFANCSFQVADVSTGLPFDDASVNAVNLADVLEHLADPGAALAELWRIAAPGATLVVSTPLRDSVFKRLAAIANRSLRGRLYRAYYEGKGATLDEAGEPVMETSAGLDHVSEMTLPELIGVCEIAGFQVLDVELMTVMSGSRWLDRHEALLAGLLVLEAVHRRLRRPSWAHSVMLRLRKPV